MPPIVRAYAATLMASTIAMMPLHAQPGTGTGGSGGTGGGSGTSTGGGTSGGTGTGSGDPFPTLMKPFDFGSTPIPRTGAADPRATSVPPPQRASDAPANPDPKSESLPEPPKSADPLETMSEPRLSTVPDHAAEAPK